MDCLKILFYVSILLIVYTYIGYGVVLWLMVKIKKMFFRKNTEDKTLPEYPDVTLLIAAYNEEAVVAEKMRNNRELQYDEGKLHIVWVTDGSTDRTNEMLAAYNDVKVLFSPARRGKTAALNRAIDYINTPIVVFTDANTMLNSEAIKKIAECFMRNPRVGCVAGEKRIEVKTKDNAASGGEGLYWRYESALKKMDSQLCTAVGAAGELFAIRRNLFVKMENDTLLDDFIMSMRIAQQGFKIEYCDKAYAIERGSANMAEEEKRKVRIAAGGLQSIWRLRDLFNIFKYGMMSFQYVSHRVLRWSITPVMLFLLIPINAFLLVLEPDNIVYWTVMIGQILFYILGMWGYALSKKAIKNKYLYIPYYFLFMNVNVIKGFLYLSKRSGNSGAWEKAKRAS